MKLLLKNNIQYYTLRDSEANYLINIIRKINSSSVMRLGLSIEEKYSEESEESDYEVSCGRMGRNFRTDSPLVSHL